jgi:hypothetical protein
MQSHNPLVPGSNPGGPTSKVAAIHAFADGEALARHGVRDQGRPCTRRLRVVVIMAALALPRSRSGSYSQPHLHGGGRDGY